MAEILHVPCIETSLEAQSILEKLTKEGHTVMIDKTKWRKDYPDSRFASVSLAHDSNYLFLNFMTCGEHLKALVDNDQGPVSKDSCVEFFVSPVPDSPQYWNFEFNCIGRINASHRTARPTPTRLSETELSTILTWPSAGTQPFDELSGVHTWSILIAIPLSLIGVKYNGREVAMTGNFYKCGSATSSPHYLSWAPINTEKPDFHQPSFFAPIILL